MLGKLVKLSLAIIRSSLMSVLHLMFCVSSSINTSVVARILNTLEPHPWLLRDYTTSFSRHTIQPYIECHPDAFFTTPEGIVGLCSAPARIGDKVVVLNGGNVPYLLRAEDGEDDSKVESARYKFVGECYLDGYMLVALWMKVTGTRSCRPRSLT